MIAGSGAHSGAGESVWLPRERPVLTLAASAGNAIALGFGGIVAVLAVCAVFDVIGRGEDRDRAERATRAGRSAPDRARQPAGGRSRGADVRPSRPRSPATAQAPPALSPRRPGAACGVLAATPAAIAGRRGAALRVAPLARAAPARRPLRTRWTRARPARRRLAAAAAAGRPAAAGDPAALRRLQRRVVALERYMGPAARPAFANLLRNLGSGELRMGGARRTSCRSSRGRRTPTATSRSRTSKPSARRSTP